MATWLLKTAAEVAGDAEMGAANATAKCMKNRYDVCSGLLQETDTTALKKKAAV